MAKTLTVEPRLTCWESLGQVLVKNMDKCIESIHLICSQDRELQCQKTVKLKTQVNISEHSETFTVGKKPSKSWQDKNLQRLRPV